MSKSKSADVFIPVRRGLDAVRFEDLMGRAVTLTVETNDAEIGLLSINLDSRSAHSILLCSTLARELAAKLVQYADTLHVVRPPRKPVWLLCTSCGKKRWRERVCWVVGDVHYYGDHCSYCGLSQHVYQHRVPRKEKKA
jgi:hypothetical protein